MKRYIHIGVLLCYLLSSAGLGYVLHYCGSTIAAASISLLEEPTRCLCPKAKSQKASDCCKDVVSSATQQDEKSIEAFKVNFNKVFLTQLNFTYLEVKRHFRDVLGVAHDTHAPPPHCKVPRYIFLQVFRI